VEAAADAIPSPRPPIPSWNDYTPEFLGGVPLLHSEAVMIDLTPVDGMVRALVASLEGRMPIASAGQSLGVLAAELRRPGEGPGRVVDCLLGDASGTSAANGLLRYLAWTAAARFLRPLVETFDLWRDEDRWARNHCPTCASAPAMAQLVGQDPTRLRLMVCGCCRTKWRFRRATCPFCEVDAHRLAIVAVEGEPRLRIESCESCGGFLKAYVGEGEDGTFLSDWSSLHLDVIAQDRGLKRLAGSLYELPR
jgi:FdhE protein